MKVTVGIILSHGFPVPAPFVIGYSALQQSLLTGMGNFSMPCQECGHRGPRASAPSEGAWRCTRCHVPNRLAVTEARALFGQDFPIDHARNRLVRLFLDEDRNSDYLLFLDADMRHPPDLVHRLVAHDKDVVTARYVLRKPPFFTLAFKKVGPLPTDYQAIEKLEDEPTLTGLVPIDAAGAGALLISRRCLEDIRTRLGQDDWFRYQDGPDGLRSRSEDMWFFEQARESGYQPYLDADLHCKHIASFEVDWENHQPYREAHERAKAAEVAQ